MVLFLGVGWLCGCVFGANQQHGLWWLVWVYPGVTQERTGLSNPSATPYLLHSTPVYLAV